MSKNICEILEKNPIIAAIKSNEYIDKIIDSDINIVFILTSNILEISKVIETLKEANKYVFVHTDLIDGLSSKSNYTIDYLIENTKLDGIISTKHNMIKYAKSKGIYTIQRFFILDSLSLKNSLRYARENNPDAVEILPGIMPKIIYKMKDITEKPVIAGGLIQEKSDIINAIEAGAYGVSSTNPDVWDMY
jgi:glycerol uptake operon antiterminator